MLETVPDIHLPLIELTLEISAVAMSSAATPSNSVAKIINNEM